MSIRFEHEDDTGLVSEYQLPSKREICGRCDGYGTHLHPAIGEHAYSQEEFDESFDDDESRAAYFQRGGMYDVICSECRGERVVDVVDEEAAGRTAEGARVLALYFEKLNADADYAAEVRAEQRFGA